MNISIKSLIIILLILVIIITIWFYKNSEENNSKLIELFKDMETNHVYEFSRMMDFIIDYSNKIEDQKYDYDAISAELTILENQYNETIPNHYTIPQKSDNTFLRSSSI